MKTRMASESCEDVEILDTAITLSYVQSFDEPSVHINQYPITKLICTDEEILHNYFIYLQFPIIDEVAIEAIDEEISKAIELLQDYPMEVESAIPLEVEVTLTIHIGHAIFAIIPLPYNDAITALESGLRGQELLDELGIVIEMP